MGGRRNSGVSLLEAVIAICLLSFAALSVLSLTQSGFVAQKRNQEVARANLVVQSVIADIRVWALDIDNYQSDWAAYNGTITSPDFPGYEVKVRSQPSGRDLDSPCSEMESQWDATDRGKRTMPSAVVPVELSVSWSSNEKDVVRVLTYIGEPKRDITGITYEVTGPSHKSLGMNGGAEYGVIAKDAQGRPFPNLMFQWAPDLVYLSPASDSKRDGRTFRMTRDKTISLPDVPPPTPPTLTPVTCYTRYAGEYLNIDVPGVELP